MNDVPPPDPEDARARLRRAADRVDAGLRPISQHPWITLGTAFGIGLVLGAKPGLRRTLFSLLSHRHELKPCSR